MKKTFWQSIGLASTPTRGRKPVEKDIKLYFGDLNKINTQLIRKRTYKTPPYTKREKKVGLATVGGAGVGFVIGGLTFGAMGMLAGVPIGTFAGNIYAQKKYKPVGRKPYIKYSGWQTLWTTREERLAKRREIGQIARVHRLTIKKRREYK